VRAPSFEPRRRKELQDALLDRARTWLADWHPRDDTDFATALFKVAARIESEVTQRLDRAPEKAFRAFLDWLGVKGKPGLAARMPVVFTMTPGSDPVDAPVRVQLQVNTATTPINFETEKPLRILPGTLGAIVGADPKSDAFFLPPPGIFNLEEPARLPSAWRLKSEAPAGTDTLQLDPPVGLAAGMTLSDPSGQHYRVTAAQGAIVTIEPAVGTIEPKPGVEPAAGAALPAGTVMTRVDVFTPFSATERNRQEHALYIGSAGALNIETPAWIAVEGGAAIPPDATWWYSGKASASSPVSWRPITELQIAGADLLLHKPAGAIDTFKIDGYQSRWLKASRTAGQIETSSDATALRLSVNCKLPDANTTAPAVKALEGIANTTPLVLDAGFYPFGREPRQFDSFYLGSKEAFSKPNAKITLHFELGDAVHGARAAIGLSDTEYLSVGIGDDGRLQRIAHGLTTVASVTTPALSFLSPTQPIGADQRPIRLNSGTRPGAALLNGVPHATSGAANEVWLWKQIAGRDEWESLGKPFADAARVEQTAISADAGQAVVYAVADAKLYRRVAGGADWQAVNVPTTDAIVMVAPVVPAGSRAGQQIESDGVVAVSDQGEMFLGVAGTWTAVTGGPTLDPAFHPLVVRAGGARLCVTRNGQGQPVAWDLAQNGPGNTLGGTTLIGHALDFVSHDGTGVVAICVASQGTNAPALAIWDAFNNAPAIFQPPPSNPVEGPLIVGAVAGVRYVFVPAGDGKAYVTPVGQVQHLDDAGVTDVAIFSDAQDWSQESDLLIEIAGNINNKILFVDGMPMAAGNVWVMKLSDVGKPEPAAIPVDVYQAVHPQDRAGIWRDVDQLEILNADAAAAAAPNAFVYVDVAGKRRVIAVSTVTANVVTLASDMPSASDGDPVPYRVCTAAALAATLLVELRPAVDISSLGSALSGVLANSTFESQDTALTPRSQSVRYMFAGDIAVLDAPWDAKPAHSQYDFFVKVALLGTWTPFEPPTPRNPTLSWEYYDGTAWRPILGLEDFTESLAKTGPVEFCLPKDLKETDVVGRTNNWVRARLVGGDYGQETVTVTTAPGSASNTTTQTVERNTDSIRAPYVGVLTVEYVVCCAVTPDVVLARDNGGLRDQTNVNRNAGAILEYFVPLSAALTSASGADATAGATDRALFLGFDTKLIGGPIQILFLVDEGTHDAAFPLRVDGLAGGRFTPVVVSDDTRGLNENGVVTMHLAESPQLSELFGTTKYWLRVRPSQRLGGEGEWQPRIRAAYLNATWAVAADTQEMEPLGSSDGSPNQRFRLARPPIIEGSLYLRILERLGDEEVEALRRDGTDVQKTLPNVPERTGCWVLWKQVVDPADEGQGARVYALDDATGIITFGDGLHGMIPPIGTNVILAERYQRGGGEAANTIGAWAQINLVTPLSGVNAVVNPDAATGGSDPQDANTTVRFAPANLRLRDRALTLADFELLALQSSRDIAQARAIPTRAGMRLVLAMRGPSAAPRAAVVRELRTYLLNHASPMLAGDDVLQITGPEEIVVRIDLALLVDAIESSGSVAADARVRVATLLDPAIGGHDGVGWALGEALTETEIAAALIGIEHLEGITSAVVSTRDGGSVTTLKPSQLIRLAPDGVAIAIGVPEEVTA
jgi:hypothetical protein